MTTRRRLGAALRALRQARGLSQEQLALAAGTTQGRVSVIEAGTERASLEVIDRIAAVLGGELVVYTLHGIDPSQRAA